jgi:hypothetical protein
MNLSFTPTEVNLVIAGATCIASVAAVITALFAKSQANAAWNQANLLRPRPVLVVEGSWNLEAEAAEPDGFLIRNLGSSPAFDIVVSDIEGPTLPSVGYAERLVTQRIFAIAEHGQERAIHHRMTPGGPLTIKPAYNFMKSAPEGLSPRNEEGYIQERSLNFELAYSSGQERFVVPCIIRFWLGLNARAWITPAVSWYHGERAPEAR